MLDNDHDGDDDNGDNDVSGNSRKMVNHLCEARNLDGNELLLLSFNHRLTYQLNPKIIPFKHRVKSFYRSF